MSSKQSLKSISDYQLTDKDVDIIEDPSPFTIIDKFPATAKKAAKRNYAVGPVTTHPTFQHQLIMLGRANAWMHFDNQNAVDTVIQLNLPYNLSELKNANRAKYFKRSYR